MKIEILYFDGCPNHKPAINLVHQVLREISVSADVVDVNVPDSSTATATRFLGSPTIRVDGLDVEPGARTAREYAVSCRTYFTDGRIEGLPSRELVRRAVHEASNPSAAREAIPSMIDPALCVSGGSSSLPNSATKSRSLLLAGSVLAAFGASLCCTLPIIFALSGFSILGASAYFDSLRPYLLAVTCGLLGSAFYYAYRPLPPAACAPGAACTVPDKRRSARIVLWLVTALVIALAAFPYYSGRVAEFLLVYS